MKRALRPLLVAVLTLGLSTGALAQTDALESTSVFAPDSPFFFIQRVLDAWEEFIAFDPVEKAAVHAKIAQNRLAEASAMLETKKEDLAARLSEEAAERMAAAAEKLAEAQARAAEARANAEDARARGDEERARGEEATANARQDAIDRVLAQLIENDQKRQEALESALDQVEDERAREAIMHAMERSAEGLRRAAEAVGSEGKPEDAGQPEDTGAPENTGRPEGAGEPEETGRPESVPPGPPESAPTGRPESAPGGRP